jgi:hypothetical protein
MSRRQATSTRRRDARPIPRSSISEGTLERVRAILAQTCEQDGQGTNLSEASRRKAYRAGINRALAEIESTGSR